MKKIILPPGFKLDKHGKKVYASALIAAKRKGAFTVKLGKYAVISRLNDNKVLVVKDKPRFVLHRVTNQYAATTPYYSLDVNASAPKRVVVEMKETDTFSEVYAGSVTVQNAASAQHWTLEELITTLRRSSEHMHPYVKARFKALRSDVIVCWINGYKTCDYITDDSVLIDVRSNMGVVPDELVILTTYGENVPYYVNGGSAGTTLVKRPVLLTPIPVDETTCTVEVGFTAVNANDVRVAVYVTTPRHIAAFETALNSSARAAFNGVKNGSVGGGTVIGVAGTYNQISVDEAYRLITPSNVEITFTKTAENTVAITNVNYNLIELLNRIEYRLAPQPFPLIADMFNVEWTTSVVDSVTNTDPLPLTSNTNDVQDDRSFSGWTGGYYMYSEGTVTTTQTSSNLDNNYWSYQGTGLVYRLNVETTSNSSSYYQNIATGTWSNGYAQPFEVQQLTGNSNSTSAHSFTEYRYSLVNGLPVLSSYTSSTSTFYTLTWTDSTVSDVNVEGYQDANAGDILGTDTWTRTGSVTLGSCTVPMCYDVYGIDHYITITPNYTGSYGGHSVTQISRQGGNSGVGAVTLSYSVQTEPVFTTSTITHSFGNISVIPHMPEIGVHVTDSVIFAGTLLDGDLSTITQAGVIPSLSGPTGRIDSTSSMQATHVDRTWVGGSIGRYNGSTTNTRISIQQVLNRGYLYAGLFDTYKDESNRLDCVFIVAVPDRLVYGGSKVVIGKIHPGLLNWPQRFEEACAEGLVSGYMNNLTVLRGDIAFYEGWIQNPQEREAWSNSLYDIIDFYLLELANMLPDPPSPEFLKNYIITGAHTEFNSAGKRLVYTNAPDMAGVVNHLWRGGTYVFLEV